MSELIPPCGNSVAHAISLWAVSLISYALKILRRFPITLFVISSLFSPELSSLSTFFAFSFPLLSFAEPARMLSVNVCRLTASATSRSVFS